MSRLAFAVLLSVTWLAVAGCGRELAPPATNQPPETTVQADPPVTTAQGRSVWVYFFGEDADGEVVAYEWTVVPSGSSHNHVSWTRTVDSAVEIVFGADEITENDPGTLQRTILARAIDDDGAVDATPASVAFSPLTLSPQVVIDMPVNVPSLTCSQVPVNPIIGWTASDADSPGGVPEAVRILVLTDATSPGGSCLTQLEFEQNNPFRTIATEDARWSGWIPYDPQANPFDPSRSVWLDLPDDGTIFLVAAQARDVDGAITKDFVWGQNVRHFITSDSIFPVLRVEEPNLGAYNFVGTQGFMSFDVVAGQSLDFYLDANAPEGGLIDAYRWGWNVTDPDDPNDPGWGVAWGIGDAWQNPPPRSFTQGSPNFVAQVRDHTGTITRATYQLQVYQPMPPEARKDILLVDDWYSSSSPSDQLVESAWDVWWNDRLSNVAGDFDPLRDVIDAQDDAPSLTLGALLQYDAVVWFVNASDVSFLHARLAPLSTVPSRYNWLEMYQRYGGNVLMVGPGTMFASIEHNVNWRFPIVFDTPAVGDLGFGTQLVEDELVNSGTLRWPYRGFCLESIDYVRPPAGQIYGEIGLPPLRFAPCDAVYEAEVSPEFMAIAGGLGTLHPTSEREQLDPTYRFVFEEFYNVNVTSRDVDLVLRDCQVPMFLARTRGDAGFEADCDASPNGGTPIAVMSTAYESDKPGPGADFVWGFNPIGFVAEDVEAALEWIVQENWQLAPAP